MLAAVRMLEQLRSQTKSPAIGRSSGPTTVNGPLRRLIESQGNNKGGRFSGEKDTIITAMARPGRYAQTSAEWTVAPRRS